MAIIGMTEMRKIFSVIDELGIHREKIEVPLQPKGSGAVETLPSGKVRITIPEDRTLEGWLSELRSELEKLDIEPEFIDYDG